MTGADPALASGMLHKDFYCFICVKFIKCERVEGSKCYEAADQLSHQIDRGGPSKIPGGAERCFSLYNYEMN